MFRQPSWALDMPENKADCPHKHLVRTPDRGAHCNWCGKDWSKIDYVRMQSRVCTRVIGSHDVERLADGSGRCGRCESEWSAKAMRHADEMAAVFDRTRTTT